MDVSGDELAGVVDLFGALTREELGTGLAELAFKQGEEYDPDGFGSDIETAVQGYYLVELDADTVGTDDPVLAPGPGAFPALPPGAADLLHILELEHREIDRATAGAAALDRFRADAAAAVDSGDPEQVERLLDVSYELEAWADVELSAEREHLDGVV